MSKNTQTPRPKPTCPICQVIRRNLLLAMGLGVFAYYAFSPDQRTGDIFSALLGYLTLKNAIITIVVGIIGKLAFSAAKNLRSK